MNNSGFWELIPMQNGRFCRKAPVRMRITADQSDLFRNRKLGRLGLIAEPLGVDLGIFAVGDDLLQAFVDLVAQFGVALAEGDAEILVFLPKTLLQAMSPAELATTATFLPLRSATDFTVRFFWVRMSW